MIIGVPKEIKNHEYRVGLVPSSVQELTHNGHRVLIETQAGTGIGCSDDDYKKAGAEIIGKPEKIFATADMIIKVKEPQPNECQMLRKDQILFTYLHLAPDPRQTQMLIDSGCIAIAYETVTDDVGGLPLLAPMSEVAGRLAIQAGIRCLEKPQGGYGVLLGGVPGVAAAKVVVIGGGVVGKNAIQMAVGLGAEVVVLDRSLTKLRELDNIFGSRIKTIHSNKLTIEEQIVHADLVIGAVLVAGDTAPKLITCAMLTQMKRGSVIVDVAIDQGGCCENSHPTTHANPTYEVDGIIHYCVANMPGAVPRTSAYALNNATLPFSLALANYGYQEAMRRDVHLRNGLNIHKGQITCEAVAKVFNKPYVPAEKAIQVS